MNIGSGKGFPLSQLRSDSLHAFELDGVKCASIESFVQGLKFEKPSQQVSVCKETPKAARERGKKASDWKNNQTLWWKGVSFDRRSSEHRELLFRALSQVAHHCSAFREALLHTGSSVLECPTQSKEFDTPVTEAEFSAALTSVRTQLMRHSLSA